MKNKKLVTVIAIITGTLMSLNLFPQETAEDPLYSATIRADTVEVKKALADGADIDRQSDKRIYGPDVGLQLGLPSWLF